MFILFRNTKIFTYLVFIIFTLLNRYFNYMYYVKYNLTKIVKYKRSFKKVLREITIDTKSKQIWHPVKKRLFFTKII